MLDEINLINFIDLNLEEKKMILSWRNNPEIKKWMYDDNDIELNNHLTFIESLKTFKNKLYFLVKRNEAYLGVIDFTNIDMTAKNCEFGLYGNVDLKGVGKILLNAICEYAFNRLNVTSLHAEVFESNTKAIFLYEKFGFKETLKRIINEKKVICMELKNEDR